MDLDKTALGRRQVLRGGAAAAVLAWPALGVRAAEPRQFAVVSLIGNELVFVYSTLVTGSSMDRNAHQALPDPAGTFDKLALAAMDKAIERAEPGAKVSVIGVGPSALHDQSERLFDGSAVALPDALVTEIERSGASHLLLLTKHRAEARLALAHSHIGMGMLSGVGYYIDRQKALRVISTGQTGQGLLAPYVHARLTLAEARSGRVLRQANIAASRVYSVAAQPAAVQPWEVMTETEKVTRLRALLETQLAQAVPQVLAAG